MRRQRRKHKHHKPAPPPAVATPAPADAPAPAQRREPPRPVRKRVPAPVASPPAAVLPDVTPEPTALRTAVPVLLIALLALLLFVGDLYLMASGGTFSPLVFYPYHSSNELVSVRPKTEAQIVFDHGKRVYRTSCAACHQETGLGVAGQFPPLTGSDWVNTEGANRIIRLVLNGISGPIVVNGQNFNNVMVPWRDTLKDDDIAAVITYVRSEWGNKASGVTPDQVKKIREATQDKPGSWTAPDLLALPDKE